MTHEEIIRILLVDYVELVRHTLRTILSAYPRFAIVGEACDGEEALAWVQRCDPSVVVMDIQMPRLNGIQATALIKRFSPHVIVVGLSVHATEDLRQEMITAGATSYPLKTMPAHGSMKKSRKPWITGPRCYRNGIPPSGRWSCDMRKPALGCSSGSFRTGTAFPRARWEASTRWRQG